MNAASDRVPAETICPLDQHDVKPSAGRRQGRPKSAAAPADHGEITAQNSRAGVRVRSVDRARRCEQQGGEGEQLTPAADL